MPITLSDGLRDSGSDVQSPEPRFQVMAIILITSFFAVSFPGVSKAIPFLKIPHIVFFIGKHFGTGVILATAFIHLLQDSFESLQKRQVQEHFHHIGKYTGLIILASLLSIFLVEYLSTSYVDHLQAESSLPPTPLSSQPPSPQRSRRPPASAPTQSVTSVSQIDSYTTAQPDLLGSDETTPLLRPPRTQSTPHLIPPSIHSHHHAHHGPLPAIVTRDVAGVVPIEVLTNSPRIIKMRGCTCVVGHACACAASALSTHSHTPLSRAPSSRDVSMPRSNVNVTIIEPISNFTEGERSPERRRSSEEVKPEIGRRRQVIGLLFLQLGIMIHSIVIGLTLAITTGADFTSLTTAVVFHQLFEGLSLGIRIAALPPPSPDGTRGEVPFDANVSTKSEAGGRRGFVKNIMMLIGGEYGEGWLKCSLAILFAITTPAGMGLGMIAFGVGKKKEGIELARMYLIQGLMSAISAGMLIYVSTVEMIAGDFVFGDVEGHSHHGHGHSHELPSMEDEERGHRTNQAKLGSISNGITAQGEEHATLPLQEYEAPESDGDHRHYHHHHHGKIGKKVLAVLSLLAGVGGMVLVGLGE